MCHNCGWGYTKTCSLSSNLWSTTCVITVAGGKQRHFPSLATCVITVVGGKQRHFPSLATCGAPHVLKVQLGVNKDMFLL